jgi:hypothetical protein
LPRLLGMIAPHEIAGGRASALFAVLAGVSLALISGGSRPERSARIAAGIAVRALTIALIGLVLGELPTTIAIILTYYGALFLLGLPFDFLRWRTLAVAWLLAWTRDAPQMIPTDGKMTGRIRNPGLGARRSVSGTLN